MSAARASTLCACDADSLRAAIQAANDGPEGSTWDIHVHTGTIPLDSEPVFLPAGDKDNKIFTMSGGWTGSSNQCTSQTTIDPQQIGRKSVVPEHFCRRPLAVFSANVVS